MVRRTQRRAVVMAAALCVVAAACSGASTIDEGAADAPPTTAFAPSTTTTSPTDQPTVSTLPAPTAPAPTTTPAPSASAPSASGATDEEAVKTAVLAGYELYLRGLGVCAQSPTNCRADQYTVPGSLAEQNLQDYSALLARNSQRAQFSTPSQYLIASYEVGTVVDSRQIVVCWTDSGVLLDTLGTPDVADDRPVDDGVAAVRSAWVARPYLDGWRISQGIELDRKLGVTCAG